MEVLKHKLDFHKIRKDFFIYLSLHVIKQLNHIFKRNSWKRVIK
jgi:hypothetical protein